MCLTGPLRGACTIKGSQPADDHPPPICKKFPGNLLMSGVSRRLPLARGILDERNRASSRPIIVFLFTGIIGCRQGGIGFRLDRLLCLVQGFSLYLGMFINGRTLRSSWQEIAIGS